MSDKVVEGDRNIATVCWDFDRTLETQIE
jgi:hypothetical protein